MRTGCVLLSCLSYRVALGNLEPGTSHERPVNVTEFNSLAGKFGQLDAAKVHNMVKARGRRTVAYKAFVPTRGSHRSTETCDFPIDLHILQDATGSFEADFLVAADEVVPRLNPILKYHPGSTVSLTMFRDKPLNELGEENDYCVRPVAVRTDNLEALSGLYRSELSSGGYDWPENQFGALVEILQSPTKIPWMTNPDASKLIVLITDAPPHFAGDGKDGNYPQLTPWTGFNEAQADQICSTNYYPTPDQVANAVTSADVRVGFVIARPDEYEGKAFASWEWFNGYIGQRSDYLTVVEKDSIDGWAEQLVTLIENLRQDECGPVDPLPSAPPVVCEKPKEERCDDCDSNVGCCARLNMPKVLIAHHNPPSEIDWTIKLRDPTILA
eukprot:Gregarina_sp_Pseudo_9__663@NODE_1421_length_1615_cov_102_258883_g1319_i0_p1_GENE_NODE_1421_length_1615_cov_102_258883_g1319_i0NODE_1421_length_1615_cov_102_258883_g1319_i0_p1_ORF_typecomplete_len385_score100_66Integrin_beta/PF00362_18/4_3e20VWA/PF00092_28/0_017_NODE_1421_length_1615_cov_102_258883_g1319_i03541508